MVLQRAVHTGFKRGFIGQISNAHRPATHFVFIGRADATTGGADLGSLRGRFLAGTIQLAMDRQDQRRVFRDHQRLWRDLDALLTHGRDLFDQMPWVQHHTIADDRQLATAHNTRRQRVQLIDLAVDHEGMARVMAPLESCDDVSALAEPIDDLAFSLIAPLGADDDDVCHIWSFSEIKPAPF